MATEAPDPYLLQRLDGFQDSIVRLDQKIDDKLGDHSTRIAKLEVRSETQDGSIRQLGTLVETYSHRETERRRWVVATFFSALVAVCAVVALFVSLFH